MTSGRPVLWALIRDLERTGVPIALARMVEWQASRPGGPAMAVHVVAERGGPLAPRLASAAKSLATLEPREGRTPASTVAVGVSQLGATSMGQAVAARAWRRRLRHLPAPDIVLVHGAGACRLWRAVSSQVPDSTRLVVHLHELDEGLSRSLPDGALPSLVGRASAVLAVCAPVADLAHSAGADPGRICIVPGCYAPAPASDRHGATRPAGAAADDPRVVGMGPAGWRKGTDRFIGVAHELRRTHPSASAHWIGGRPEGAHVWAAGADLAVTWHPSVDDPWVGLAARTVLLLPSREDPLPLVVLEAGARAIPVVTSATGGLPELLGEDRGLVVDGHDVAALAAAVAVCLDDPDGAERRAARLQRHVRECFNPDVVGPAWLAALTGARGT